MEKDTYKKDEQDIEVLRELYSAGQRDKETVMNLAQYYTNRGWYNEAIDILKDAIANHCDNYMLLLEYGNTCFRRKDYKTAVESFRKVTELKPQSVEGWNNLGIGLIQIGEFEAAREAFSKVLQIEPQNPGALMNVGNCYYNSRDYEEARNFFKEVIKLKPDFTDAWFNLGNTFIELEDYGQARISFEKALNYDPEFFSALKNLGFVYDKMRSCNEAENCYLKAIEKCKADAGIRVNLGNLYLRQKKFDDARRCFLKAVRLAPYNTSGWMGLRYLALIKGDLNMFVRATLASLPRLSDEILAQSIEILYEFNQLSKAEEILAQADRLGRTADLLDLQKLLIAQKKGSDTEETAEIYKRLCNVTQTDTIRKGLARYALEKGLHDQVIKYIQSMENPDDAAYGLIWRAFLAKNEISKAKQQIQNYIKENPESYDCWFLLARIEALRGHRIRAERFLVRALENGFTNLEELNQYSDLKEIFDSLAQSSKDRLLECH